MRYGVRKILFFVLLWIRPLVHLPLRLLSFLPLLAFAVMLIIPHPMPLPNRVLMASVGVGCLALTWVYDFLPGSMAGDALVFFE